MWFQMAAAIFNVKLVTFYRRVNKEGGVAVVYKKNIGRFRNVFTQNKRMNLWNISRPWRKHFAWSLQCETTFRMTLNILWRAKIGTRCLSSSFWKSEGLWGNICNQSRWIRHKKKKKVRVNWYFTLHMIAMFLISLESTAEFYR